MAKAWHAIEDLTRELSERYISDRDFVTALGVLIDSRESPISGLQFDIARREPHLSTVIGMAGPKDVPPDVRTIEVSDPTFERCQLRYWIRHRLLDPTELIAALQKLFNAFWKPSFRTVSAGLFDIKRDHNALEIAQKTVEWMYRNRKCGAVIAADLDNFKSFNDSFGQVIGDELISAFGSVLEERGNSLGIALHRGGDEFALLLTGATAAEALLLMYGVHREFGKKVDTRGKDITVSSGIALILPGTDAVSFHELLGCAEDGLNEVKGKQQYESGGSKKGTSRLRVPHSWISVDTGDRWTPSTEDAARFACCLAKVGCTSREPFANAYINSVSQIAYESLSGKVVQDCAETIAKAVKGFVEWIRLGNNSAHAVLDLPAQHLLRPITSLDVCAGIAHGIYRYAADHAVADFTLELRGDLSETSLCLGTGAVIYGTVPSGGGTHLADFGEPWTSLDTSLSQVSPAILVQIGFVAPVVSERLFSARIVVDDRPTRGGGLPDFWEAVIAQVITHAACNPNIDTVYVFGDETSAAFTVEELRHVDKWIDRIDRISYKTGTSIENIRKAAQRISRPQFPSDESALLEDFAAKVVKARGLHAVEVLPSREQKSFLQRDLRTDEYGLGLFDGCRVDTIAKAFPVVLEIIRSYRQDEVIQDQVGHDLKELSSFKVTLIEPSRDQVPQFYKDERESLESYFEKQFCSEGGLFQNAFQKNSQLEYVVKHISQLTSSDTKNLTSRRAILVVPHEPSSADLTPLGLIAVHVVPKIRGNSVLLNFSYFWRTVEALVGFPYSLYASVRFSEWFLSLVEKEMKRGVVGLGEVAYVASNLHMTMDDYGQCIAKKIVDEASR